MAFYNLTDLIQKTITRLRMVSGESTSMYASDAIAQMLEETYEMVRAQRWWDHLMEWQNRPLDGVKGQITFGIDGCRERFRDVKHIYYRNNSQPLPILSQDINPYRLSGTVPRYVEPLNFSETGSATKLFRIWPLTAVATGTDPIRVRVRVDPPSVFTDPSVVIPFDATCLINGAAFKYAADDGTNPASVESLRNAFEARRMQLERQHDNAVILLDPRQNNPIGSSEWTEDFY